MEMSFNVNDFLDEWRKRNHNNPRPNNNEPLRKEALKKAKLAAEDIKTRYPNMEIYLFGSLIWNYVFTDHSDIDIAIKGLKDKKKYLEIHGRISDVVFPFEVDLVLLEDASDNLRNRIIDEGLKL
ncbi:MAG: nucleotidyltransferase domain-containing protein [Peptococcaceae bacterium]|nr:nucleotidyltransferase domain-containing protein [Peptococcaceae bacterium]